MKRLKLKHSLEDEILPVDDVFKFIPQPYSEESAAEFLKSVEVPENLRGVPCRPMFRRFGQLATGSSTRCLRTTIW